MNIVVCVKQVPGTNEVKMNEETNTIIREGMEAIINPFDTYAVEEGVRLKEQTDGKVTAISMGIPSVADLLKETIGLGVDEAVLLSDRTFAGADSLATSYALAKGIEKIGGVDLIICGKQATDGDTAQVGPSLAEKLGIPHTTYVKKIEEISEGYIRCERMTDDGYEVIEMTLPAVITVVKEINEPRLPSMKGMMRAKKAVVQVWTADDVGADKALCGLDGSPTQVVKTFVPVHNVNSEMIEGEPNEQAKRLADVLMSMQFETGN
ncbi:MAG: electron transfer flavoprotein subunit beta/FixA family protein [Clostridia bacterium]|nr:electron transfer flavoprotein subunit beta/FixA family protein [Clostridia bacterium]MBT7121523.1 electron transfer flavoprotein subunit beta/FixA family protein [Clostridia bacterium]